MTEITPSKYKKKPKIRPPPPKKKIIFRTNELTARHHSFFLDDRQCPLLRCGILFVFLQTYPAPIFLSSLFYFYFKRTLFVCLFFSRLLPFFFFFLSCQSVFWYSAYSLPFMVAKPLRVAPRLLCFLFSQCSLTPPPGSWHLILIHLCLHVYCILYTHKQRNENDNLLVSLCSVRRIYFALESLDKKEEEQIDE